MNKQQKQYLVYGSGGLVLLYLLYRWYQGRQAAGAASYGGAPSQTAADYGALAGSSPDIAAGQGQDFGGDIAALRGQEAQDVAGLQSQLAGLEFPTWQLGPGGQLAQSAGPSDMSPGSGMPGTPLPSNVVVDVLTGRAGVRRFHRPVGAPLSAIWSGPNRPAGYRGIGGGWWVPADPHVHNPHITHHQPGAKGHVGGHTTGAVAPRSHNPRVAGHTHTVQQPRPQHPAQHRFGNRPQEFASGGAPVIAPAQAAPHAGAPEPHAAHHATHHPKKKKR